MTGPAALLLALMLLVAGCAGAAGADPLFALLRRAAAIPSRRTIPPLAAAFSLIVSGGLALIGGAAVPQYHDEFSYLLAADTFAHGRLTNPPHPMAIHIETFHVLQRPTYSSKYPPGQGLMLASGRLLLSAPLPAATLGAALGAAAACAALAWALMAVLPAPWALAGGLLISTHPLVLYWSRSYWGGQVTMIGGALLLGAVIRLRVRPRTSLGLVAGIGVGLLAIGRPFEGLVLTILCGAAAIAPLWRSAMRWRILAAALFPLAGAAALVAMDNWRVTGHVTQLPYLLHESQYVQSPAFIFMSPLPPRTYPYKAFRDYYAWQADRYWQQRSLAGILRGIGLKCSEFSHSYLDTPWVALPLIGWLLVRRRPPPRRRIAIVAAICAAFLLAELLTVWYQPHYTAPALAALTLLVVGGARRLAQLRLGGYRLGRALVVLVVCMMLARFADAAQGHALVSSGWGDSRLQLVQKLQRLHSPQLMIVRDGPGYDFQFDWVYNDADIDASPIVWVRDAAEIGDPQNLDVRRYFANRQAWILTVGNAVAGTKLTALPPLVDSAPPKPKNPGSPGH